MCCASKAVWPPTTRLSWRFTLRQFIGASKSTRSMGKHGATQVTAVTHHPPGHLRTAGAAAAKARQIPEIQGVKGWGWATRYVVGTFKTYQCHKRYCLFVAYFTYHVSLITADSRTLINLMTCTSPPLVAGLRNQDEICDIADFLQDLKYCV